MSDTSAMTTARLDEREYVTFRIGGQLFGLPITQVQEVFAANQITRVPRAPGPVRGLLNLRGRVVTAICLASLLGIGATSATDAMAIGVEIDGENFALLVDKIGDVMPFADDAIEPPPVHLDQTWQQMASGVRRLPDTILVLLDLDRMINSKRLAA
jgi:purine-binding chemotaxis protein CheW